jgi:hypothetical protein
MLPSFPRRMLLAAALFALTSCETPSPDSGADGLVRLEAIQDHAYYPHALVDEFKQFNLDLKPTAGRVLETAVVARVRWEVAEVKPGCDVVVALWHTAQWYNYAWAGDGELMNAIPNWWGLAQETHPEIRDMPLAQNPTRLLDVFTTAKPIRQGRALTAWYVKGILNPADLSGIEAYVVYGCGSSGQFKVTRLPTEIEPVDRVSPAA